MSLDINVASIVSVAVLLSFSHCIGMCSGFFALCAVAFKQKSISQAFFLTLIYHLCRIVSYVVLGALFGAFGSIFLISNTSRAVLFFVVGILLVIVGFALLSRGKLLNFIENDKISKFITKKTLALRNLPEILKFCLFGILNGLLPCGVVYYFLAMSIAGANALQGAFIMALFGFSTLPAMLSINVVFKFITQKFKQIMFKIAILIIILNGIYLAFLGFMANG
ncbi:MULTISPECIES: sulfite exporter TauE/SafE family protein [unclassified Campylobacter]|uniref:sulfite exporter TauE/SafE family protein n=1 Tax=unclassified Campylobacter TaxID=2593542 RepID=UPI003D33FA2F